jgi:hypothetical protein
VRFRTTPCVFAPRPHGIPPPTLYTTTQHKPQTPNNTTQHKTKPQTQNSLSCAKYKILTKSPPGHALSKSDKFGFNADFTDKMKRIKVPLPPVDEKRKVLEDVDKDRRYAIDAAIVRTMKARKAMQHQQLVLEVVSQLSRMFKVWLMCREGGVVVGGAQTTKQQSRTQQYNTKPQTQHQNQPPNPQTNNTTKNTKLTTPTTHTPPNQHPPPNNSPTSSSSRSASRTSSRASTSSATRPTRSCSSTSLRSGGGAWLVLFL